MSTFDYYLLIIKGVKPANTNHSSSCEDKEASSSSKKKKKKKKLDKRNKAETQIQFINQEDGIFFKVLFTLFD